MMGGPTFVDFPQNMPEFESKFSTEEACRDYLVQIKWPNGFCCPKCDSRKYWPRSRNFLFECTTCGHQTSITAGTIFEGTRKPLQLWFRTIWLVTSGKNGVSALNVQRQLGFKRYETVWVWLHKIRRAMVRPGRDRLSGEIEVDETFVGGIGQDGKRGRGADRKSIVLIALEVFSPKGFGRVRICQVADASADSLIPFVCEIAKPGSTILTDGWPGYNDLPKYGFVRKKTVLSDSGNPAHVSMPGVHRIAALLKRWLLGTHQGAVDAKHLDYYLDEFTFRFNRRTSHSRGKLFYRLLQNAIEVEPLDWVDVAAARKFHKES